MKSLKKAEKGRRIHIVTSTFIRQGHYPVMTMYVTVQESLYRISCPQVRDNSASSSQLNRMFMDIS